MNCSDGPVVRTGTGAPIDTALDPQAARTPDPSRPFLPFRARTKDAEVRLDQRVLTTENTESTEKKKLVILSDSEESKVIEIRSLAFARDDNKKRQSMSSVHSVFEKCRDAGPALRGVPTPCPSRQIHNRHAPEMTNGLIRSFTLPIIVTPAEAGAHAILPNLPMDPGLRRDDE
jgi:hypothetical protein